MKRYDDFLVPTKRTWDLLQAALHQHNLFNAAHGEAIEIDDAMDLIDSLIENKVREVGD